MGEFALTRVQCRIAVAAAVLVLMWCLIAVERVHSQTPLGTWTMKSPLPAARAEVAAIALDEMAEVARRLGISQRTLGRRLASEGHTFGEVLDSLRFELATRYLQEHKLPTSEVAWLLGYQEASAFYHAFKRWTGKTPRQTRSARSDYPPH